MRLDNRPQRFSGIAVLGFLACAMGCEGSGDGPEFPDGATAPEVGLRDDAAEDSALGSEDAAVADAGGIRSEDAAVADAGGEDAAVGDALTDTTVSDAATDALDASDGNRATADAAEADASGEAGSDASPCDAGAGWCTPTNACHVGALICSGGSPVCSDTGARVADGTPCGANAVCEGGSCNNCTAGASCAPANPCEVGSISCATGQPACTTTGTVGDGTPCGQHKVCSAGTCVDCTAGLACAPLNACHTGTTSCAGGTSSCTDTGTSLPNGIACGANHVCSGGSCVACAAGGACTPSNACHSGIVSCATGAAICQDTGDGIPNGTSCGSGLVCSAGTCVSCNGGQSCVPSNACYATGQVDCSTGAAACTPTGSPLPNGTSCGVNNVCSNGTCNACTAGAACSPGKTCHVGALSCATGSPICTDTGTFTSDCWEPLSNNNAPTARAMHDAAWTGSRMVVWGGEGHAGALADGGTYDPATDTWQAVYLVNVPPSSYLGTGLGMSGKAVFLGGLSSIGGYQHGAYTYDPATGVWGGMSGGSPGIAGTAFAAVTTGTEIIWCGSSAGATTQNYGWVFTGFSTPGFEMSTPAGGAGCNRNDHSAVWTGSKVLFYGGLVDTGSGSGAVPDGNSYDPATDSWTSFAGEGFPRYPNRWDHSAVWTGTRMLVWGGHTGATYTAGSASFTLSGGSFDPGTKTWTNLSEANAPSPRKSPAAYWTGSKMIVWGGTDNITVVVNTGAVYDPATDKWTTMASPPWGTPRGDYSTVWTGTGMIVWGGGSYSNDGAIYHP